MALERLSKILLVEDDEIDIKNVKRAFKKNNMQNPIEVAHNGEEALDILTGNNGNTAYMPDVVLLDINMPRMNGIEFLQYIRNVDTLKHLHVFIMTSSESDENILEAYNLNVAGYIVKPLSFDRFMEAMATLDAYWKLTIKP